MAKETKFEQINRILDKIVKELKQDKNTLGIFLKGSAVTGKVWEESDIDLIRITKTGSRDVYWNWVENVRIEITDICLKDWTKKKKRPNFEQLEPYLFSLDKTKIIYDPKKYIAPKFKKCPYPKNLKLYLMLSQLSDARYYIKGTRKMLAFKNNLSCYQNLRRAMISMAGALFALNEVPREPRFWFDEFKTLKRAPKNFRADYEKVMSNKGLNNKEISDMTNSLWDLYDNVREFCYDDVVNAIKELGGTNKAIKDATLTDLYVDVLREMKLVNC